jgi:hypothetical protein
VKVPGRWPLAGAAVLVVAALSISVSLPGVRGIRLRHAPRPDREPAATAA